ncbi:GntR family transcriptional regulator [Mycobacteroides abscessus subsp. abscessus]|nr:GntR family transcriptional regulator [Mycobacteroides abscessus subsp. abscessus]
MTSDRPLGQWDRVLAAAEIDAVVEIRRLLEVQAAGLAAERRNRSDVAAMRLCWLVAQSVRTTKSTISGSLTRSWTEVRGALSNWRQINSSMCECVDAEVFSPCSQLLHGQ